MNSLTIIVLIFLLILINSAGRLISANKFLHDHGHGTGKPHLKVGIVLADQIGARRAYVGLLQKALNSINDATRRFPHLTTSYELDYVVSFMRSPST